MPSIAVNNIAYNFYTIIALVALKSRGSRTSYFKIAKNLININNMLSNKALDSKL
ncbi:hypothetical protein BDW02DRAFT_617851 [Decorospora gaudefroyi]|uniref:Uncharacterized protein n=1 Tax=Decorospora gaudefroyi TaxID=184978 RepID=A0A6A5JV91_9PLEO|nr:hypothetical protein BDW02DRAFT_617851 [Decorospora gaudefroyi]